MTSRKTNGTRPKRPLKEPDHIEVHRAREHNLDIDHLVVPKHQLVVFTGVSGSGKSSLAFDTLYAEGQRRYVESLSAYARQFLGRLERPNVERLRGLSPTIAIEQKSASSNPRSTVGTITEVYDYLRVLYARAGVQHCHICGKVVRGASPDEIVGEVMSLPANTKLLVMAPLVTHRKGEFKDVFAEQAQKGFVRVRVDGEVYRLDEPPTLDKKKKHTIELIVDRVAVRATDRQRITESVEQALSVGAGEVVVEDPDGGGQFRFSEQRACCGHAFPELSPQSFSFNSPLGMCPGCNGLGTRLEVDPEKVIADPSLSIREGAIAPWRTSMDRGEGWTFRIVDAMAKATKVNLDTPWKKLPKKKRDQVLFGLEGRRIRVTWGSEDKGNHGSWGVKFEGILNTIERRYQATSSQQMRDHYMKYMSELSCEDCGGRRLRPESLAVKVDSLGIAEITEKTVKDAHSHFDALELRGNAAQIAEGVLREVQSRLKFLLDVGLEYLTLDRSGPTLSGGEAQRIRLASQLGSELSGVMYVLDEPSIGLHARDNLRLVSTLQHLRDLGNTVIVVEHDEETIRMSDYVVDFGPGAGHLGGKVVFSGTPEELVKSKTSLTGAYLSGKRAIEMPETRRKPKAWLRIEGARLHNLDGLDVKLPVGVFSAVTGVSGAGKSSLVNGILLPAIGRALSDGATTGPGFDSISGLDAIDRVIAIDQKPIGRTPRSNPGTYTKAFDEVRGVFAGLPEARTRGFSPGRFSFNVKGGRCEACQGDGVVKVEMHFLSDVYVRCEVCDGRRYNAQTLTVKYRGHSIADVLDMSVDDCLALFENFPKLSRILKTIVDVGLGYIKLGQPATTMSGGEAQRVKLSRELGKRGTGKTLYVLDEPTTGLHFADIEKLLGVLQTLVDVGNTVLVIEHNLDVVKCADWVLDLGPEGGGGGGHLVAEGTPEQVARQKGSYTGTHLAPLLGRGVRRAPRKQTHRGGKPADGVTERHAVSEAR
jgi:excinuclease ABC subunit A